MIAVVGAPLTLLVMFLLSLVAAAAFDVWKRYVPNLAVIVAAVTGIAAFLVTGNQEMVWQPLLVAVAVMIVGLPLFARGWVGGGDIKLLAAASCWFTAKGALQLVASVFLAGGALALAFLAMRLVRREKLSRTAEGGIPYAVAIALGAAWQVWQYRF